MSSVQGTYKASLLGWWGWLGQIMDGGLAGRKKSSQMLLEDPSSEGNYSPSSLIICWAKVPLSERWDPSRILLLFSPHFYSVPKNRLCMYIFHIIAFQTMNKKLWLSQNYISEQNDKVLVRLVPWVLRDLLIAGITNRIDDWQPMKFRTQPKNSK